MQHIRNGHVRSVDILNIICLILRLDPSEMIEITPMDEEKIRFFKHHV